MQSSDAVPVLHMEGVTKTFPGVRALSNADLVVSPGEIHGLIGENGAGKSTIIKVLAGIYRPDSATALRIDGEPVGVPTPEAMHARGIRFVHQELYLVPYFTVAESVFMGHELTGPRGLRTREMRARARTILRDHLGIDLDPKVLIRDIGPAQKKLVQIARALIDEDVRLIVLDEPTAPLAANEVAQVLGAVRRMRERGIAALYVSHYLGEVAGLCDRVTVFRDGRHVGTIDEVTDASPQQMIEMMTGRAVGELFPERVPPGAEVVIDVDGISDGDVLAPTSFQVKTGEVFGVAGLLGSGRERLVDCLVGLRRTKSGRVRIGRKAVRLSSPAAALDEGIVLIPRDRRHDGLVLDLPVATNINLSTLDEACRSRVLISEKKMTARSHRMIVDLDIRPADDARKVRLLSGGNQQKVVIARAMLTDARVLILDEPTVGVDVGAKSEIYALIAEMASNGTTVLVSSNDPSELLGLCHRIAVLVRGEIVAIHDAHDLTRDSLVREMTQSQRTRLAATSNPPGAEQGGRL